MLTSRWSGPRISFGFTNCPICKVFPSTIITLLVSLIPDTNYSHQLFSSFSHSHYSFSPAIHNSGQTSTSLIFFQVRMTHPALNYLLEPVQVKSPASCSFLSMTLCASYKLFWDFKDKMSASNMHVTRVTRDHLHSIIQKQINWILKKTNYNRTFKEQMPPTNHESDVRNIQTRKTNKKSQ